MRNNLWNIFRKEVRELFRDKKSLSMMLIIPVFIPLIILGMSALFESQANKDVTEYNRIGFAYEMSQAEKSIAETMDIDVVKGTEKELEKKFADGDIDLYVARDGKSYIINGDSSDTSTYSAKLMESYYNTYKEYLQQDFLRENNIDADQMMNIITVEERFADEDNFFAGYIKNYAFLFIIMAITVSATYPSTDTTAGERERGTLETLLTFPIKSRDIIIGKF